MSMVIAVTHNEFLGVNTKMKNIEMWVACTNADDRSDIFVCEVDVTEAQFKSGRHKSIAGRLAKENGFDAPYVAFCGKEKEAVSKRFRSNKGSMVTVRLTDWVDNTMTYDLGFDNEGSVVEKNIAYIGSFKSDSTETKKAEIGDKVVLAGDQWRTLEESDRMDEFLDCVVFGHLNADEYISWL
ncbi:MAG: hypothetical protein ACJAS1_000556 [Oleiphilaceae bacterium]|jgi:hypothetical protein